MKILQFHVLLKSEMDTPPVHFRFKNLHKKADLTRPQPMLILAAPLLGGFYKRRFSDQPPDGTILRRKIREIVSNCGYNGVTESFGHRLNTAVNSTPPGSIQLSLSW